MIIRVVAGLMVGVQGTTRKSAIAAAAYHSPLVHESGRRGGAEVHKFTKIEVDRDPPTKME